MDDATLAVAAREGDREAFAAIYDRYADRIHDFCCSVLRDRAEAADAMQDTFLSAAQKLGQLRDPSKLRAWLFAIARHESLRRAKSRTRAIPTADFPDLTAAGSSPEDEVRRSELSEIVWAAAAGLADTIGVTPGHAYVLMNRLRTQVERALGALLADRFRIRWGRGRGRREIRVRASRPWRALAQRRLPAGDDRVEGDAPPRRRCRRIAPSLRHGWRRVAGVARHGEEQPRSSGRLTFDHTPR